MSYYEYRVVPAPKSLPKVKGQKSPEGRYSHAMSEALNAEGRDGWEFQRSETIETSVKRGFLSKSRSETLGVLIFRRWVEIDGPQSEHPFEPAMAPAPAPTASASAPAPDAAFETRRIPDPAPETYEDALARGHTPEPEAPTEPVQTRSQGQGLFARRDDTPSGTVPPLRGPDRD